MRNKQPFYHRAVILFTATRDIPQQELERQLKSALRVAPLAGVIKTTIQVEECDSEPGDPQDLTA